MRAEKSNEADVATGRSKGRISSEGRLSGGNFAISKVAVMSIESSPACSNSSSVEMSGTSLLWLKSVQNPIERNS